MFRIKICGITSPEDAELVAEAGADAVGFNFFPGSSRCISLASAEQIAARLPPEMAKVGLFVNGSLEQIAASQRAIGFDYLQFHGDEPPEFLGQVRELLPDVRLIRAIRLKSGTLSEATEYVARCAEQEIPLSAVLLDAYQHGQYGGTGTTLDWGNLRDRPVGSAELPWILAGGLTPRNVKDAILAARPSAVDTASGVENEPGQKCPVKTREFVTAARRAFDELDGLSTR